MAESLKERIQADMKNAMRQKDAPRLGLIRLILAAVKQREVDERITLDDEQILASLGKMVKQRRDSIAQYQKAERQDLVDQEAFELGLIEEYLPPALSDEELAAMLDEVIEQTGATSAQDMGKVMGVMKSRAQGRADMGAISSQVKQRLSATS